MAQGAGGLMKGLAERSMSDWIVGGVGVGAAVLSAGFATYMIAVGPGKMDPRGSGNFGIFAAFDRRVPSALADPDAMPPPDAHFASMPPITTDTVASAKAVESQQPVASIDFAPTGSIGPDTPAPAPPRARAAGTLDDFVLRDVFDGKALVEGRHRLSLVSTGTMLDGAGAVQSIRQENGAWVVVTDKGVIRMRSN